MSRNHTNVFIIVGARGTGKTTYIRDLATRSALRKKIVIDTFDHPHYSDYQKIEISDLYNMRGKEGFFHLSGSDISDKLDEISRTVYNSFLVFEDCLKYVQANVQPSVREIVLDSKQKGNDVFFLYHSWSQVPPKLCAWADYLTTFKTMENIDNQRSRLGGVFYALEPAWREASNDPSKYANKTVQLY